MVELTHFRGRLAAGESNENFDMAHLPETRPSGRAMGKGDPGKLDRSLRGLD